MRDVRPWTRRIVWAGREATLGALAITQPRVLALQAGRNFARLLSLVAAVVLALLLSGAIFHVIPNVTVGQTSGISMEPGIKQDDVVVVHRQGARSLKVGDVIVFRQNNIIVLHRVIGLAADAKGQPVITTMGDNNQRPDKPVTPRDVQAKLLFKVPLLGAVSRAIDAGGGLYVYRYAALAIDLALVLLYAGVALAQIQARAEEGRGLRGS